jgi:RimJ/RimL family protein N-acetyltransferase
VVVGLSGAPDSTRLEIRPIEAGGKADLASAVEQSSGEAVYRRFLGPHGPLTTAELRYLTEVDHHDHEALIAFDQGSGDAVGVARYVRTEGPSAEAAVTVQDDWQGRGLGTALTSLIAERALDEGIDRFTAMLLAENKEMIALLESLGQVKVIGRAAGTIELEVPLEAERPGAGKGLYGVLRAARRLYSRVESR